MVEILDSGRTLDENDIARLENVLGCALPSEYRTFLLQRNGGRPKPDTIDVEGAPFKGTTVGVFHGIDTTIQSDDLLWNLEVLEGCKENKLLPIASDPYGHIFMLVVGDNNFGHVNYFDSSEIPPRPYFVAHDFNEFLSKIRDLTPEEQADIDAAVNAPD